MSGLVWICMDGPCKGRVIKKIAHGTATIAIAVKRKKIIAEFTGDVPMLSGSVQIVHYRVDWYEHVLWHLYEGPAPLTPEEVNEILGL